MNRPKSVYVLQFHQNHNDFVKSYYILLLVSFCTVNMNMIWYQTCKKCVFVLN